MRRNGRGIRPIGRRTGEHRLTEIKNKTINNNFIVGCVYFFFFFPLDLCGGDVEATVVLGSSFSSHNDSDNESVQTQSLTKNEDEHHAYVQAGLLGRGTHTSVTDDTNAHTGTKTRETSGQSTGKSSQTIGQSVTTISTFDSLSSGSGETILRPTRGEISGDNDGNNETINGNHTGKNDGNNGTHHQFRLSNTHGRDTN